MNITIAILYTGFVGGWTGRSLMLSKNIRITNSVMSRIFHAKLTNQSVITLINIIYWSITVRWFRNHNLIHNFRLFISDGPSVVHVLFLQVLIIFSYVIFMLDAQSYAPRAGGSSFCVCRQPSSCDCATTTNSITLRFSLTVFIGVRQRLDDYATKN